MQSQAATPDQYVSALPPDRQELVSAIRAVINQNLPADVEEGMQYGMIGYYVPHRVYPGGYHVDPKQPLPYVALASQAKHVALYLMTVYASGEEEAWFRKAWTDTGRKLDMGKSCVRFKKLSDVPLDVVGEAIRRVPAAAHIAYYESARAERAGAR
jgi:hypothetical protein